MSKTRDTGFLGNVVKYDANGNVNIVSGATTLLSVSSSGQLTIPGNEVITGSLTVLGGITGAITGSATSASYAANTSLLNGSGSGEFVPTGSFNTFSSSILTYTGSVNSQLSALQTTSGSNITRIGALESASGSAITRLSSIESTTGSLNTASGSAITRLNSIEAQTGSYATTGSNTFIGNQTITGSVLQSGSLSVNGCIVSTGAIVAQTINVQQVTSSVVYSCGSNIFGTAIGNTQTFTGSMFITGSNVVANIGNFCVQGTITSVGNIGIGTPTPGQLIEAYKTDNDAIIKVSTCAAGAYFAADSQGTDGYYGLVLQNNGTDRWLIGGYATSDFTLNTARTGGSRYLTISRATGVACFSSNVCVGNTLVVGSTSVFGSDMFTYTNGGIFFSGGGSYNAGVFGRNCGCDLILQSGGAQRVNITSTGVACFSGQICAVNAVLTSGGTERYLQLAGYNNAYATIRSNVGFNTSYNNLSLLLNVNSNESGQGNSSLPSWAINLGGNEGDQDSFIVARSAAGSYSFNNLLRVTSTGTVCASRFSTTGIGTFLSAVCSNYMITFCDTGDTRYLQSYVGAAATYNSAADNTVNKIVAGLSFNWYNDCWQIGATRGGSSDIQSLVFGRNGANRMVLTSGGFLGIGTLAPQAALHSYSGNASTVLQTGSQNYVMFGKVIQSYGGTAVNLPLFIACPGANNGLFVKIDVRGVNAVGNIAYTSTMYAFQYRIGGTLQATNVVTCGGVNLGNAGYSAGTLCWCNAASSAPVLVYSQNNNGYILEALDVYVTTRDSAEVYFCTNYVTCG